MDILAGLCDLLAGARLLPRVLTHAGPMADAGGATVRRARASAGKRPSMGKARGALEQLKAVREGGGKRTEQFQSQLDDDVYDVVDENEYKKLVDARRKRGFVVADGKGHGYQDYGEEGWDEERAYSDESDGDAAPGKKGKKDKKGPSEKEKKSKSISNFFMGSGIPNLSKNGSAKRSQAPAAAASKNVNLDDLLADLRGASGGKKAKSSTSASAMNKTKFQGVKRSLEVKNEPVREVKRERIESDNEDDVGPPVDTVDGDAPMQDDDVMPQNETAEATAPLDTAMSDSTLVNEAKEGDVVMNEASGSTRENAVATPSSSVPVTEVKKEGKAGLTLRNNFDDDKGTAVWTDFGDDSPSQAVGVAAVAGGNFPVDEDGNMAFYWTDAYEDPFNSQGRVFLFGKVWVESVKAFISCCVTVEGIQRDLYFLKRDVVCDADGNNPTDMPVTDQIVREELKGILHRHGVKQWKGRSVSKKYSFENPSVPHEAEYFQVLYSSEYPVVDSDLTGKCFSAIFGSENSPLEGFMLKKNFMGPCWLKISAPVAPPQQLSWCKLECTVKQNAVSVMPEQLESPPMVVMSLNLKTMLNPKIHNNEIMMVSAVVHRNVSIDGPTQNPEKDYQSFVAVRKMNGQSWPLEWKKIAQSKKIQYFDAERALLNFLMAKIQTIDPDVIVDHNFLGFGLDVLLHRMSASKTAHWSRLGRLRRSHMPKLQGSKGYGSGPSFAERAVMSGRLVCDTFLMCKELLRETNYSLSHLAHVQLKQQRHEVDLKDIPKSFETSDGIVSLATMCRHDAYLCMSLMFHLMMVPLTKQLTGLCGNLWSRSLMGARAERIEYLLLHQFTKAGYVVPNKGFGKKKKQQQQQQQNDDKSKSTSKRKKAAYAGGLVLEPKKGFYDKFILLLDFNSLYPSIIQEYNICYTTVKRPPKDEFGNYVDGAEVPKTETEGILPAIISTLVARRRAVKKMLKTERDPLKQQQLDIRQKALKLVANSMYGCLGFENSRFFARPIAELITRKGREALQNTVELAEGQLNLEVIYGDTDSIMVNTKETDLVKVRKIGHEVKAAVNKQYQTLEIDIDGVFKSMLLLKKKKYAALTIEEGPDGKLVEVKESKGLDLVRRDWCQLSKDVGNFALDRILSGASRDDVVNSIHERLREVRAQLDHEDGPQLTLDNFIIYKSLTKHPEEYPDAKSQPHVQVALKMRAQGESVQAGDTIGFVICKGDSTSIAERAYSPKLFQQADGALEIDIAYYKKQQIHPPVARLCEPIAGTDAAQIADCLGLKASEFVHHTTYKEEAVDMFLSFKANVDEEEKFKDVDKLIVSCPSCSSSSEFKGVFRRDPAAADGTPEHKALISGLICSAALCGKRYTAASLSNAATLYVRKLMTRFTEAWMVCDEVTCQHRSRDISLKERRNDSGRIEQGRSCLMDFCKGKMKEEFSAAELHLSLTYLESLFDTTQAQDKLRCLHGSDAVPMIFPEEAATFDAALNVAKSALAQSAYHHVDLSKVFSFYSSTLSRQANS